MIHSETIASAQTIADTYDRCSSCYDFFLKPWLEAGRPRAMELLDVAPHHRVLEVGVGTGLSFAHYPEGSNVVGVDFSAGMLRQARRRVSASKAGSQVELMQSDAQHLPFPDASFDRILAAYVLTVVPDTALAVRELLRVLRPDGRVVLINHLRSENKLLAWLEDVLHPVFSRIGLFTLDRDLLGILSREGAARPELEPTSIVGLHYIIAFSRSLKA